MKNIITRSLIMLAGLALSGVVHAAEFTFTPDAPVVSVNFTNLDVGDPIKDLSGWSGDANNEIVGIAPRSPLVNTNSTVITTTNLAAQYATSPDQTLTPEFLSNDVLYFSAWMSRSSSASSGGRIYLQDSGDNALGGFAYEPASARRFGLQDATGAWHYGTNKYSDNIWYELALVIDLNLTDITLSRGYLFYREATQSDFQIVEGLEDGALMQYTLSLNATNFAHWETYVRNNVQIDNLAIGTGTLIIPEVSSLHLLLGSILAFVLMRRFRVRRGQMAKISTVFLFAGILFIPAVQADELLFKPNNPIVNVNFSNLADGDSITSLPGWSSKNPNDIVGISPRKPTIGSSDMVLTTPSENKQYASSPSHEIESKVTASDTVYFSAWINRTGSVSSGTRITFLSENQIALGALAIEPGSPNRFGISDANGEWHYSSQDFTAKPNTWYEVVFVVHPGKEGIASSRGYLFYREVAIQDELQVIPGLEEGILMGHGDIHNAGHFATWTLQLRNNVQIDNLAMGTGVLTALVQ